jgi:hypothetical protein
MANAIFNQPPPTFDQWISLAGPEIQQRVEKLRQQEAADEGPE